MKQALWAAAVLALVASCRKQDKKQVADVTTPGAAPRPAPPDAAPPRARGPEIHVVIESRPSGAAVWMDGRAVGSTPLTETTVGDGHSHQFKFQLPGYEETIVKMMLMRDGVVTGVLRPLSPDGGH